MSRICVGVHFEVFHHIVKQFQALYEDSVHHEGLPFSNALEAGIIDEHVHRWENGHCKLNPSLEGSDTMSPEVKNIFKSIPEMLSEEWAETIAENGGLTIERIVSRGHRSPGDFWYDQDKEEFVILLKGRAGLLFEGSDTAIVLNPGDYLRIPAHRRHQVKWTSDMEDTIWLAVHYQCRLLHR